MATSPDTPPAAKDEPLTLLNLTNELASVSEWYTLGIQLGVQPHQLEAIRTSSVSMGQKRAEMLHAWLKNSLAASWQNVVTALKAIGEVRLAETIEKKYQDSPGGTPPFSSISSTALPLTEHSQTTAATTSDWTLSPSFSTEPQPKRSKRSSKTEDDVVESVEQVEVTRKNLAAIKGKFADLLDFACAKLQEKLTREEVMGKFFMFLLTIFSMAEQCIPKSYNLEDVFTAITSHDLWNYWNYYPLEEIIMKYGKNDPDMIERMENYKRDLSGFKLITKIKNYIPAAKAHLTESDDLEVSPVDRTPNYFRRLSIKWNARVTEYSLRYIENVWQSLSSHLLLPPPSVLLEAVIKKSILVVWLIPVDLVPKAIEKARQSTKLFQIYPILEVVIDGECVYKGGESTVEEDMERIMEHSRSIQEQRSKTKTVKYKRYKAIALASLFLAVFTFASVPAGTTILKPVTEQIPNDRVQRSTSDVPYNILPIHITMPQFSKHKRESTKWSSEPFYTHLEGYKLSLLVNANGHYSDVGTHVSVYLHLMPGEFDNKLEWPFQGSINIQLLNQMENTMHYERILRFTGNKGERVTEAEMAIAWGFDFISHRELIYNPQRNSCYLKNDVLHFRVALQAA